MPGQALQYLARSIDACVSEPCHRRHAGLFTKSTAQCSSRHVGPRRKRPEVEWKCKVFEQPVAKGAEWVGARAGPEPVDDLRFASRTARRSSKAAGPVV